MSKKSDYNKALSAAEQLSQRPLDGLYEQLGLRIQDLQNVGGYARSQQFSADFKQDALDLFGTEDLKEIGRKWWKKFEKEMVDLVCVKNNEEMGKITSGKTIPQVAASLATTAVISTLAPPAWVIVAATIIATKLVETGLDALCEQYNEAEIAAH